MSSFQAVAPTTGPEPILTFTPAADLEGEHVSRRDCLNLHARTPSAELSDEADDFRQHRVRGPLMSETSRIQFKEGLK